jgi:hypothetical protein
MTPTTLNICFTSICDPPMPNTSCHGHKNVNMDNEMIDLNLNLNKNIETKTKLQKVKDKNMKCENVSSNKYLL